MNTDESGREETKQWYKLEDWSDSDISDPKIVRAHEVPNDPYSPHRPELESTTIKVLTELAASSDTHDEAITATKDFEYELGRLLESLHQESDLKALQNGDDNFPALEQKLRVLVARYIAQQQLAGEGRDDIHVTYLELLNFIKELYLNHIPLYDLAFAEWDKMREDGRSMLEVYIGRDSVYAYAARRALNIARGRKPEEGISYLVFPRIFNAGLSKEEKTTYLKDCGINHEQDPVIFDLCYNGTVPEAILKALDFSEEEVDKRIFLLSAKKPERQFKTIPNTWKEIAADLQYTPKMEERAMGISHDPQNGKVTYIAKATTPKHQFLYLVLEFILTAHYLQKDRES